MGWKQRIAFPKSKNEIYLSVFAGKTSSKRAVEIITTIKQTRSINHWIPCLADILADDWEIIQIFWNGSKDDFMPFQNTNIV
jgi:hypothetical protein